MASSDPTNLPKLLGSLSVTGSEFTGEEAFSNLRQVEVPLNAGVKDTAGFVLKKSLNQGPVVLLSLHREKLFLLNLSLLFRRRAATFCAAARLRLEGQHLV